MKQYTTFEDIEYDLKVLNLERQIAFEELKGVKGDLQEDFKPSHWLQTLLNIGVKIGSYKLLKKIF